MKVNDPAKIAIREKALAIIDGFMRKDEQIKIQYAAKYATMRNSWKKWQGEVLGLTRTNAVEKKKSYETEFQKRVNANPLWKSQYGNLLSDLQAAYNELKPYGLARDYYLEISSKIELFAIAAQLNSLLKAYEKGSEKGYADQLVKVKQKLDELYNEYSPEVDRRLFESLMEMYVKDQPAEFVSLYAINLRTGLVEVPQDKKDERTSMMESMLFTESLLSNKEKLYKDYLSKDPGQAIELISNDKAVRLYLDMVNTYNTKVAAKLESHSKQDQSTAANLYAGADGSNERKKILS